MVLEIVRLCLEDPRIAEINAIEVAFVCDHQIKQNITQNRLNCNKFILDCKRNVKLCLRSLVKDG